MKHTIVRITLGALLVLPVTLLAAEKTGVGTVKGTITMVGKPTPDAVVAVEGISSEDAKAELSGSKTKNALMDQREMKFIPLVLAILVGTSVEFPNNDTSWHNVYSKGGAKDFDLGLYAPGKVRSTIFDKPGVARILCNVHPNMVAFVVVKEHPYFSTSDSRGNYTIKNVPIGKFRLEVWHPSLGTRTESVNVTRSGEVMTRDIDLKNK